MTIGNQPLGGAPLGGSNQYVPPPAAPEVLPKHYAIYNSSQIIVGPKPSEAFSVELCYFAKPVSLVDTGSTWLGDNAEACLLSAVLLETAIFLKAEEDILTRLRESYALDIAALKTQGEGYNTHDSFRNGQQRKPR